MSESIPIVIYHTFSIFSDNFSASMSNIDKDDPLQFILQNRTYIIQSTL